MKALAFPILLLVLVACTEANVGKPQSVGEPYDVTLVATDKRLLKTVSGMMGVTMAGLPQEERLFTVKTAKGREVNAATMYERTIVVVRRQDGNTRIRYERNPYARDQLLVFIDTPSAEALRADSAKTAKALQRLIDQFETQVAMNHDRQNHNLKLMRTVEKTIGCNITIPSDIRASKTGKDFVWISDNGTRTMRNICVYAVNGIRTSQEEIVSLRDSVMAANIKGEREGMVMRTERRADVMFSRHGKAIVARGLWHMEGDAMGGPFVSVTLPNSARNRTLTAEAFVYAPSTTKARTMKRLEAVLYSLDIE